LSYLVELKHSASKALENIPAYDPGKNSGGTGWTAKHAPAERLQKVERSGRAADSLAILSNHLRDRRCGKANSGPGNRTSAGRLSEVILLDPIADQHFMARALELARAARAQDEVPIGAVLVRDGVILAEGKNEVETRQDATAHAEMLAVAQAQAQLKTWRLTGVTLYVTKEPCPMCAGALAHVRVDRIVFGAGDPKAGACGGAFNLFDLPGLNHRCEIAGGVEAEESRRLLQDFFRERRV
jgi:tRNA(adenine34) deaminase